MLGLISFFLFGGYTLVYAAVANGGKFAAAPWEALRRDAYDDAAAAGAGSQQHPSTWDQILKGAEILTNPIGALLG